MMFFLILFLALTIINAQNECSYETTNCIDIHKCPEMTPILRGPRPLSAEALQTLRNSQCSFEGTNPKICCNQETTTTTIATRDSENIPNPPDVTNHSNLRLLDHVACGPAMRSQQIIFGGNKTGIFEYPWMALIAYDTEYPFLCAGTIISSRYVLTAAHCVTSNDSLIGVRVGDYDISKERDCEYDNKGLEVICADRYQDFGIDNFHFHPDYNATTMQNDIALIRLNGTVDFRPNVRPICLPFGTATTLIPKKVVVTGWGETESGLHQDLLQANLPLVTNKQCKEIFRNRTDGQIWYKQICAGGERNVDSCAGDSGGPLQVVGIYNGRSVRMIQHGVVSYGLSACGTKGVPAVYTRVVYYMDWILDTMTD